MRSMHMTARGAGGPFGVWCACVIGAVVLAGLAPLLAQTQTFAKPAGVISNVTWSRVGTTFTVTYDLTAEDQNAVFDVKLEALMNGVPFIQPFAVSGAVNKVSPGVGKKISWESAKDTDRQDLDQFRFTVEPILIRLKEIDVPVPPKPDNATAVSDGATIGGTTEPNAGLTTPLAPGEIWRGTYAGFPAQLTVVSAQPPAFSATLMVIGKPGETPTQVAVDGRLDNGAIELREIRVEQRGGLRGWELGSGMGRLAADGGQMNGSGNDRRTTYEWSFARVASIANLAGRWEGEYAGAPAVLQIDSIEGSTIKGRLMVTTQKGKDATTLQIDGMSLAGSVQLREVQIVSLGAAKSWKLGSGTGAVQSSGLQLVGTGSDGQTRYDWYFVRR